MLSRQRQREWNWKDCCGYAAAGRRASDLGLLTSDPTSDPGPQFQSPTSEARGLKSEVWVLTPGSSRLCESLIYSCKAGVLAWWRLILAMCRTRPHDVFRWPPGFAFSAPSTPPQRCYWSWPRHPVLRLVLLC